MDINDKNESSEKTIDEASVKRTGGLYSKINMSLKTANIIVAVLVASLLFAMIFIVNHGSGFTVKFDTNGGSQIESCKVMYSEKITLSEEPVKEGWRFTGWYIDSACTQLWDIENDVVSSGMTLYAGWEKAE